MRRTLAALLVGAVAVALAAVPATPAAATTGPGVSIKVNETKLVHGDPITGVSTQFQASNHPDWVPLGQVTASTPKDCEDEPAGCVVIPITLDVPEDDPDLLEAAAYLLTVVVSYDAGQQVDNAPVVSTVRQNDVESYLYQDPQVRNSSGTATYSSASHSNNPAELTAVAPTSPNFKLAIANYFGVNNGYTLQISLIKSSSIDFDPSDYDKHDVPDYVQPTDVPPHTTPQDSGFGGSDVPPISPSTSSPAPSVDGAGAIVVPKVANGKPDGDLLAMSKVSTVSGLGRRAVAVSSTVVTDKVSDSSTGAIVATLLALPVAALVITLLLLGRRRKSRPSAPAVG
jgi:hypothetical protein